MELERNIQEISEKSNGFQLDDSTIRAIELLKELQEKGFIHRPQYNIPQIDTIGKEYHFLNIARTNEQKSGI